MHLVAHHDETIHHYDNAKGVYFDQQHHHCDHNDYTIGYFLVPEFDYFISLTFETLNENYSFYKNEFTAIIIASSGLDPPYCSSLV